MEYLVFLKIGLGLVGALSAAIYLWSKNSKDTIERPIETDEGDFLIKKPENAEELPHDDQVKLEAIKDPKGKPSGRPE